jgi:alpha-maltose-1-phosphate synthase
MNITLLTNEYPPHVYGGAGVHVEYLTRELARVDGGAHSVEVFCFGDQQIREANLRVTGVQAPCQVPANEAPHARFFDTMVRDLAMAGKVAGADIVHCHTWYSHFAGCLVKQLAGSRLVLTTHSLEPHRPWKAEQLGTAYRASSWIERTAYENADGVIAVSEAMRDDVIGLYGVEESKVAVIPNGIDPDEYRPTPDDALLRSYDIDPDTPYVLFVGRITRQKGILHLVNAIRHLEPGGQVVLCAGAPDTEEIAREMTVLVEEAQRTGKQRVVWLRQVLPRKDVITLYTHATAFVCPSVYEPFGIINLEAMACETAVVASAVGGIREVVVDGETGTLVPIRDPGADFEPADPEEFAFDLAQAVNRVLADPDLASRMGQAGRKRVEEIYSWKAIAERTVTFYQSLLQ